MQKWQKWPGKSDKDQSLVDLDIEIGGGGGVVWGAHLDVDLRGSVRKKHF